MSFFLRRQALERHSYVFRPVNHLGGSPESLDRRGHAAINAGMQQHFLNFFFRGAIVQRAAHVAFEFMLFAQRRQHRHRNQAARLQVQPGSLPGVAPGVARDLVLDWQGKVGRGAERVGNEVFAHDLFTGGQAFVKLSIHVRVLLKKL